MCLNPQLQVCFEADETRIGRQQALGVEGGHTGHKEKQK